MAALDAHFLSWVQFFFCSDLDVSGRPSNLGLAGNVTYFFVYDTRFRLFFVPMISFLHDAKKTCARGKLISGTSDE